MIQYNTKGFRFLEYIYDFKGLMLLTLYKINLINKFHPFVFVSLMSLVWRVIILKIYSKN